MSFHNIDFPFKLALGAIGGPVRQINIAQRMNGMESRQLAQYNSRRRYTIATPAMTIDEGHDLLAFFEARFGKAYSFRFRDPFDFKSCAPNHSAHFNNIQIGIGDGENKNFQLTKNYGEYQRPIYLPKTSSVQIALNGALCSPNSYVLSQNGVIGFNTPPSNNEIISAGFEFDTKVRFDMDNLEMVIEAKNVVRFNNIELIEVLA